MQNRVTCQAHGSRLCGITVVLLVIYVHCTEFRRFHNIALVVTVPKDSSVSKVTGCGLCDRGLIPARGGDFFALPPRLGLGLFLWVKWGSKVFQS